jgi:hypothetical protein
LNEKEHEESLSVYVFRRNLQVYLDRKHKEDEQNHIMMSIKICNMSTLGRLDEVSGTSIGASTKAE